MAREKPSSGDDDASDGEREIGSRVCFADGGLIEPGGARAGWCTRAQAYAVAYRVRMIDDEGGKHERARQTRCPFVCPICRSRLTWDGGCDACHGSAQPGAAFRDSWTFPGDRYELAMGPREDGKPGGTPEGHYERTALGPRPVATEAEALAALGEIKRMLAAMARRSAAVSVSALAIAVETAEHSEGCDCAGCVAHEETS